MRVALNRLLLGLGLAAVAACGSNATVGDGGAGGPMDAGVDAGSDAGSDAGDDGGTDAGEDAGPPNPYGTNCSRDQDMTGLVVRRGAYGTNAELHDYYTYVPSSYSPSTEIPLIISLHGAGDAAKNFVNLWEADADRGGFMVLVPEASAVYGPGYARDLTDTDPIIGATGDIERCYNTDLRRHILHGFSAGGMIAYILGLSQADSYSGLAIASSDLTTAEIYWGEAPRAAEHSALLAPVGLVDPGQHVPRKSGHELPD